MKKSKKKLVKLDSEITPLEVDQEGKYKGGFCSVNNNTLDLDSSHNSSCSGNGDCDYNGMCLDNAECTSNSWCEGNGFCVGNDVIQKPNLSCI
jgi:hypothetical protein